MPSVTCHLFVQWYLQCNKYGGNHGSFQHVSSGWPQLTVRAERFMAERRN